MLRTSEVKAKYLKERNRKIEYVSKTVHLQQIKLSDLDFKQCILC